MPAYIRYLPKMILLLSDGIKALEEKVHTLPETGEEQAKAKKELQQKRAALTIALEDQKNYTAGNFENCRNGKGICTQRHSLRMPAIHPIMS